MLRQLGQAWDASAEALDVEADWLRATGRLQRLRNDLNQYAERLHAPHGNGFTVHQALGEVVNGYDIPAIRLQWPSLSSHDREAFDGLCDAAGRLGTNADAVGIVADNPLAIVANGEWSPAWEQELLDAVSQLSYCSASVAKASEFAQALQSSVNGMTRSQLEALRALAGAICSAYEKLPSNAVLSVLAKALYTTQDKQLGFALMPDAPLVMAAAREGSDLAAQRQAAFERLSVAYDRDALALLDHSGIRQTWEKGNSTWWPRSAWLRSQSRKALQQNGGLARFGHQPLCHAAAPD